MAEDAPSTHPSTQPVAGARPSARGAAWLAARSGTGRLLLPLSHAGEVFRWTDVRPVPYVKPWFIGVANLRGVVCGVVDLAVLLGLADAARDLAAVAAEGRLISFNPLLDVNCALVVDQVMGVRTTASFVSCTAAGPDASPWFGATYSGSDGTTWREVNLQKLSEQEVFRAIAA